MFKNILVGMDSHSQSQSLFRNVLALAKATGANLKLAHVFSFDEQCELWWLSPFREKKPNAKLVDYLIEHWQTFLNERQDLLGKCQAEAEAAGVSAVLDLEPYSGRPGAILCEVARQWPADLIAIGHRNTFQEKLHDMGELRLGSVSEYVLHHAPCSVLVDHRAAHNGAVEQPATIHHVLAALDLSDISQPVFEKALDIAKGAGAELSILHVRSSSFEGDRPAQMLQAFQHDAKAVGVPIHLEEHAVKFNETVGHILCRVAEDKEVDLMVVGCYGLSGLPELLLGSVSHYVSYHAPCAVVVVRSPISRVVPPLVPSAKRSSSMR